jgi:hypothetical protein
LLNLWGFQAVRFLIIAGGKGERVEIYGFRTRGNKYLNPIENLFRRLTMNIVVLRAFSHSWGIMWTTSGLWDLSNGGRKTVSKSGVIYQEFWRGGQAWRRTIPVENLVVQSSYDWTQSSWFGTLPGSGSIEALMAVPIP